jgi:hypothetical protein
MPRPPVSTDAVSTVLRVRFFIVSSRCARQPTRCFAWGSSKARAGRYSERSTAHILASAASARVFVSSPADISRPNRKPWPAHKAVKSPEPAASAVEVPIRLKLSNCAPPAFRGSRSASRTGSLLRPIAEGPVDLLQGTGHVLWNDLVVFTVEQPYAIIGKIRRIVDHTPLPCERRGRGAHVRSAS